MAAEPRNWKKDGHNYIGHGLIGAACVVGIVIGGPFLVLAIVGLTIQLVYQWLSFLKKGDTPGRDVGDVFAGFLVAVVVFVLWLLLGRKNQGGTMTYEAHGESGRLQQGQRWPTTLAARLKG